MVSLGLCILSSTIILVIFKFLHHFNIKVLHPIVVNYIMASGLGFVLAGQFPVQAIQEHQSWLAFSAIIGILLIGNFYLMGLTTQRAGVAVTSVATKMAFALPVTVSIIYDINDRLTPIKLLQIFLAMMAVLLVVYKKEKGESISKKSLVLPLVLFFGVGALDSLIKFSQYSFVQTAEKASVFAALNFSVAALIGIAVVIINPELRRGFLSPKVWVSGILLGSANFGSMYFLIRSLNTLKIDNSLIFGINNISIICISVLIAIIGFKERLSRVNLLGMALAVVVLFSMLLNFL